MMSRVITILEISQKQAYIYESNKLKDNIINSAVIAYVLSAEYIEKVLSDKGYVDKDNMVYSGGGHTILTFLGDNDESALKKAKEYMEYLTRTIYRDFDGLSVFVKTIVYDDNKSIGDNLNGLVSSLEEKKSIRKSAFKKGSFGIEKNNSNTLKPQVAEEYEVESEEKKLLKKIEEKNAMPECIRGKGYLPTYQFGDLGGSRNDSNFIAVVHIDGNGMGKRIEEFYNSLKNSNEDFDTLKKRLRNFSEGIDADFKAAYVEMLEGVQQEIFDNNRLKKELSLKKNSKGEVYFPVRKVVTAGDDICFVTEGRIGIECAVKFIEALSSKVNNEDKQGYSACAGVAIVHQKYPFYKAYELSEMLCSNAKSFNATVHNEDNGQSVSSIDWHIEFGEMGDSLEQIRENYIAYDNTRMNMRPYVINGGEDLDNDTKFYHDYYKFKQNYKKLVGNDSLAIGKMKELRRALRDGMDETTFYLKANMMYDILPPENEFIKDYDGKIVSYHFDIVEIMDTFLPFS